VSASSEIREKGFRRWYERRLIEAHLYLVTCFLCMILTAALLEESGAREGLWSHLVTMSWLFAASSLGLFSWLRYRKVFGHAESLVDLATCGSCHAYARFNVTAERQSRISTAEPSSYCWMRVCCRKCGNEWTMTSSSDRASPGH
jgi:hypothetical protein